MGRATAGAPRTAGTGSLGLTMAAMLFAVSMTFIDQTIVAIAAPEITDELSLSSSGMQWVVNAYLLSLAAFFALGGRLSDLYGHRRVMLAGTVLFVVSSALCGFVPDDAFAQTWLVCFRATQGLGAALMFPAALAVVVATFPVDRRGSALALFFGLSGGLTAVGPILGGWLTSWTWRAIFWVNIPVAVIAVVLTLLARIRDVPRRETLDITGAVLVAAGMGLSVLGLMQASAWGWSSAATWACIVGGLAVLALFVRVELRTARHPLINMNVFRDRAFVADNLVLFFAMTAFVPVFFFASVYAQVSLSASPNEAGVYMLVFFAGFGVASQLGGRMLDTRGAKHPMLLGTALGAVGFALWAHRATELSLDDQWPYIVMAGAGIGFLLSPASTDAVNRAISASYGEVTGITQTLRNFAAAVGLAVFGTVLTHVMTNRVLDTFERRGFTGERSAETARSVAESITGHGDESQPGGSGPVSSFMRETMSAVRMDFAEATQVVLACMAGALAVAFLCAHLHPGGRVTDRNAAPVPEDADRRAEREGRGGGRGRDTVAGSD